VQTGEQMEHRPPRWRAATVPRQRAAHAIELPSPEVPPGQRPASCALPPTLPQ
jgi:hypothetical protein